MNALFYLCKSIATIAFALIPGTLVKAEDSKAGGGELFAGT